MYDSYNEFYGLCDQYKTQPVTEVEPSGGCVERRMSSIEMVKLERAIEEFREVVQSHMARYDDMIASEELEVVRLAYMDSRDKYTELYTMPIRDYDELAFAKWILNDGKLRSQMEILKEIDSIEEERRLEDEAEFLASNGYKAQKGVFVTIVFILLFFVPGWLFPAFDGPDFHIGATITNVLVLCVFFPVQLFLLYLATLSDGFFRPSKRPDRKKEVRNGAMAASVLAALNARNLRKMGRSILSGGKHV